MHRIFGGLGQAIDDRRGRGEIRIADTKVDDIDRAGTVRYAWTGEISLAMLEKYLTPIIMESN